MKDHLAVPVPMAAASRAWSIAAAPRGAALARAAALVALLLLIAPPTDRRMADRGPSVRAGIAVDLPPLMLWAWDRNDDLRFIDTGDTGVALLAATVTLRGDGVALAPRRNPLVLPDGVRRVAVIHVETDRAQPPTLSDAQLRRFVDTLAAVGDAVPHHVLQVDFEAVASQRTFLIDAVAALREQRPGAAISVTALASWCFNESWTARLAADEVVPMLFRMGYDGRRLRAHLQSGGDFRGGECRLSLGVATDELPAVLPAMLLLGRRIYVFNPRRWSAETYNTVRTRMGRWSHARLPD
jgi:hypothetical protein